MAVYICSDTYAHACTCLNMFVYVHLHTCTHHAQATSTAPTSLQQRKRARTLTDTYHDVLARNTVKVKRGRPNSHEKCVRGGGVR